MEAMEGLAWKGRRENTLPGLEKRGKIKKYR